MLNTITETPLGETTLNETIDKEPRVAPQSSFPRQLINSIATEGREKGVKQDLLHKREITFNEWSELDNTLSHEQKQFINLPPEQRVMNMIDASSSQDELMIEIIDLDPENWEETLVEYCTDLERICTDRFMKIKKEDVDSALMSWERSGIISEDKIARLFGSYHRKTALELDTLLDWLEPLAAEHLKGKEGNKDYERFLHQEYYVLLIYAASSQVLSDACNDHLNGKRLIKNLQELPLINTAIGTHILDLRMGEKMRGMELNIQGISQKEIDFWNELKGVLPAHASVTEAHDSLLKGISTEVRSYEMIWDIAGNYGFHCELSDAFQDVRGKDVIVKDSDGLEISVVDVNTNNNFPSPVIFTILSEDGKLIVVENGEKKEYKEEVAERYNISSSLIRGLKEGGSPALILRMSKDVVSGKTGSEEIVQAAKAGLDSEIRHLYQKRKGTSNGS